MNLWSSSKNDWTYVRHLYIVTGGSVWSGSFAKGLSVEENGTGWLLAVKSQLIRFWVNNLCNNIWWTLRLSLPLESLCLCQVVPRRLDQFTQSTNVWIRLLLGTFIHPLQRPSRRGCATLIRQHQQLRVLRQVREAWFSIPNLSYLKHQAKTFPRQGTVILIEQ